MIRQSNARTHSGPWSPWLQNFCRLFAPVLLTLYLVCLCREVFCAIPSDTLSWLLTLLLSAAAIFGLMRLRPKTEPQDLSWLLAVIPGLLVYVIRVGVPDGSFDILNYHITNGERLLHGPLWLSADFFPSLLPVDPAPDGVFALTRFLFGYRLGTLANVLAFLCSVQVLDRILRPIIPETKWRVAALFAVATCENMPYLLSFYMVDLLPVPLLLMALEQVLQRLPVYPATSRNSLDHAGMEVTSNAYTYVCFLLGIATAFKLTNVFFAIPIFMLLELRARKISLVHKLCSVLLAGLPLLPHAVFLYHRTGNPFFPYYNAFFHSGLAPASNPTDIDHGPGRHWLTPIWPLVGMLRPSRIGSLHNALFYSGRLLLGQVAAVVFLLWRPASRNTRLMAALFLVSCFFWSAKFGEVRYGVYLECIAGLLLVLLAKMAKEQGSSTMFRLAVFFLAVQTSLAFANTLLARELVGQKPMKSALTATQEYMQDASLVLRDRDLSRHITEQQKQQLDEVDLWIASDGATAGVETLLKPRTPIVSIEPFVIIADYMKGPDTKRAVQAAIARCPDCTAATLVSADRVTFARENLEKAGLKMCPPSPFQVNFFSANYPIDMVFAKVVAHEALPEACSAAQQVHAD